MRLIFFFILFPYLVYSQISVSADSPNIIFILTDDMGWGDISYNQSVYDTPNIDKICTEGVYYNNFYTNLNCTPARASLMTGLHPYRLTLNGEVIQRDDFDRTIPDTVPTLAEALKSYGYNTAFLGKWHLGELPLDFPTNRGFDYFYGSNSSLTEYFNHTINTEYAMLEEGEPEYKYDGQYITDVLNDKAVEYIKSASKSNCPFFLYIPHYAPHGPHESPNVCDYTPAVYTDQLDSLERVDRYCMMKVLDDGIGRILDEVNAQGIENETLIIFTSDNGGVVSGVFNGATSEVPFNNPYRSGKGRLIDGGVHVPMAMWQVGRLQSGESDNYTHMTDFMPTLLSYVGDTTIYNFDGIDFISSADNTRCIVLDIMQPRNKWGVMIGGFKLLNNPEAGNGFGAAVGQTNLVDDFYLYDTNVDVQETNNLYGTGLQIETDLMECYNNNLPNVNISQLPKNITGFYKECAWGSHYRSTSKYFYADSLKTRNFIPQ